MYTGAIVFFAFLMFYMTFAGLYMTKLGIQRTIEAGATTFGAMLGDATFRTVVLSLASTYGLYLVSSILYFEPWHMITSIVQYLCFLPR